MKFKYDDGGRAQAGFCGVAGDCVARAIAIATERPYAEIYNALSNGMRDQRKSKHCTRTARTARNGIWTKRKWFKEYMAKLGFEWTPTMKIGSGCKVHLSDGELPLGRLVVAVSKHYTAVIHGIVHDIYDPQREEHCWTPERGHYVSRRCVYGYWTLTPLAVPEVQAGLQPHSTVV